MGFIKTNTFTNSVLDNVYNSSTNSLKVTQKYEIGRPIDFYMAINHPTVTLQIAVTCVPNARIITLVNASGIPVDGAGTPNSIYKTLGIQEGGIFMQPRILNVTGNVITIDTPIDYAFTTNANITLKARDLRVDGSTTTQVAQIAPAQSFKAQINKIYLSISTDSACGLDLFANIPVLTNGCCFRLKSNTVGRTSTFINFKSNNDLMMQLNNFQFLEKSTPSPKYGVFCYAGAFERYDEPPILDFATGDSLQLLIQDNLTNAKLLSFNALASGKVVS